MEILLIINAVVLWIVLLFNLLLTLVLIRRANVTNQKNEEERLAGRGESLEIGADAPTFEIKLLSGETITNATMNRQKLLLLFVSTTCQPCREILTALSSASVRPDRSLIVVSGDGEEQTRTFAAEMGIVFPVAIAPRDSMTFFTDFKISLTPSFVQIDGDGTVQSTGVANTTMTKWKNIVKPWLAAESVNV